MTRPDTPKELPVVVTPEDEAAADKFASHFIMREDRDLREAFARHRQAERERCARIAEMHEHRGEIAKAIRGNP